ncbi:97b3f36b-429f-4098-b919-7b3f35b5a307 [Thermothielavioides terrestris]|uniref:C3H1-type domain-containing protein n=2 Tax=Thermothielavioides terrestris TaxID=2587410 RepID=G2REE9_THETT|nr:uncharacterized protein THITE_2091621 [Thermothielavioides terrestris NRRL 8126]AEO70121.1 hypothetical protein THITE_2091621 [Thermothielavioides terrestris NRRL 8126]SPQ17918.1 97b3f36b-429f-4098-b919-7b3f35b5a307 [Thermothielavioides terrestris]
MVSPPRFFIVRPDGKKPTADGKVNTLPGPIVPLIAVDELPEWLNIVGVPRELTVEQTVGLYNLGTVSKSKGSYAVEITHQALPAVRQLPGTLKAIEPKPENHTTANPPHETTTTRQSAAASPETAVHPADRMKAHWSEAHARAAGLVSNTTGSPTPRQQQQQLQPQRSLSAATSHPSPPRSSTKSSGSSSNNNPASSPNPSPSANPSTRTEYCRHWCHHGTCKWGLHCRYLHAMPATPAELAAVGLRGLPAWWVALQQHCYNSNNNNDNHNNGHQSNAIGNSSNGNGGTPGSRTVEHALGPDTAGGGSSSNNSKSSGGLYFDPRDVRAPGGGAGGMMHPMGWGMVPGAVRAGGAVVSGHGGGQKAATRAQLRETLALLRELRLRLGLGSELGGGGGGVGGGGKAVRKREVNPLEKGRGKGVVGGDKEAMLTAAKTGGLAASIHAPAAGADRGQAQTGTVVTPPAGLAVQTTGGKGCGEKATGLPAQPAETQKVDKLVDV